MSAIHSEFLSGQMSPQELVETTEEGNKITETINPAELKHGTDPDSDFDPKQLDMGMKVEYEHSDQPEVAKAIAKAHLAEDDKYYTKLATLGL